MLYLAGIIITFFLVIILLSKKGKTSADLVLSAWLCIMGLHLFLYYLQIPGAIYGYTYLLGVQIPLPLLHGPLLYLYTVTVTRETGFVKKYWLHFIPVVLAYMLLYKFFELSGADKISVYRNKGAGFETETQIILIASLISGFSYVLFSFYELRKYKKRINDEFSNTERINLNWLRYLIGGILVIWVIILLKGSDPLIFGAAVVFVVLLGYFGIRNMGIFTYRQVIEKRMTIPKEPAPATAENKEPPRQEEQVSMFQASLRIKYEKSGLQKEAADKIHQDLTNLMQVEKVFKNEELSLSQLAQQLGIHPNNLSQVINTYEKKSFYDYINTLRIEEFKQLAMKPENEKYTLLSLAFECGFNSKTSFNRNFKKITGESPSDYLNAMHVTLPAE